MKYHERKFTDYLAHLFHYERSSFHDVDLIVEERQPISGFVVIQELILREFRDKTVVQSPQVVHTRFDNAQRQIADKEARREARKIRAVEIATRLLTDIGESFVHQEDGRYHDLADAYLQVYHLVESQNEKLKWGPSKYFPPGPPDEPLTQFQSMMFRAR